MKTISIFLFACTLSAAALAQTTSTVTINVRGIDNQSVIIDGKEYEVTADYNDNTNAPIVVSNLQAGQHTLQIRRTDEVNPSSTVFTVRNGYDLQIIITANGSVQLRETKWKADNTTGQYTTPMSAADFNNLYNSIRSEWRSSRRVALVSDAFALSTNYFTTAQAKKLIELVNNQSSRFTLAKASYPHITDPTNFSAMYDLFNSQSFKTQLQDYVSSYNAGSSSTAMTAANFNVIYRTAQRQATTNSRVSYIYNTFSNTNNYFSVSQARQLIQLVPDETNRLYLAKISYRSIVDKNNFSQMTSVLTTQAARNELATFVNNYDVSNPVYTKVAMKEAEFNTLYRSIQNKWGIGAKMSALSDAFDNENYYFTTAQAKQLIQLVSSDDSRLQLARASFDNIIDQANFAQIYDILSAASRSELEAYVRNNQGMDNEPTNTTTKTPMASSTYTSLYNRVRNTFGFGAKMASLTDIFDNESYYFTAAQAKQLIQLVSSESNRLQLAKASYGNITDPENFNIMYELLTSQTSKNELSNYVNTYSYNRY